MEHIHPSTSLTKYLRIILVIGMMFCAALGIHFLLISIIPDQPINFFVPLAILVTISGFFESSVLKKDISGRDKALYRISGFIVLAIITRLLLYTGYDLASLISAIRGWGEYFFEEFIQIQFVLVYGSFVIIWFLSNSYAADFQLIEESSFDPDSDSIRLVMGYLQKVHERIPGKVLYIGVLLIVFAVMARINFIYLFGSQQLRIEDKSPILHVVIYFILGMALMSNVRYSLLTIRWQWEKSKVSQLIGNHWIRYALIFFAVAGLIAYLLPTNYANGILTVLSYIVGFIVQFVGAILMILAYLISLIIKPLFGNNQNVDSGTPEAVQQPTPEPVPPQITPDWIAAIKPYLFWGIFILIVGGSFIYYASQNKQIVSFFSRFQLIKKLKVFFNWLKALFTTTRIQTGQWVRAGINFIQEKISRKSNQRNQPRMTLPDDPKSGIRLLYMSFLAYSSENAVKHRLSETPLKYRGKLLETIPETQEPVSTITNEFLKARYTQADITDKDVIEFKNAFDDYQQIMKEQNQAEGDDKKLGTEIRPR